MTAAGGPGRAPLLRAAASLGALPAVNNLNHVEVMMMMLRNVWADPWQEFTSLRTELDNMLSSFTRGPGNGTHQQLLRPSMNMEEHDDAIVMEVDLPGVSPSDLEVEVDGRTLAIRGKRNRGQAVFAYERILVLPENLDTETLEAKLDRGVLMIKIAKSAQARKRRIEIGGGEAQNTIEAGDTVEVAA